MHIHAKVRTGGTLSGTSYTGGSNVWIGQLFFTESVSAAIAAVAPYSSSRTTRLLNTQDNIYTGAAGATTTLAMTGSASTTYAGSVALSVAAGAGASTTVGTTISGATTRTTTYGKTVTLAGTAPAGSSVEVFFRRPAEGAYVWRRTLTASAAGAWSTTFVANDSYAVYAEAGDDVSDVVLVLLSPTIAGASTRTVAKGTRTTVTGTSAPGTVTTIRLRRAGQSGYPISRTVRTSSSGAWSFTFAPSLDHRLYAVAANGTTTASYLVRVR